IDIRHMDRRLANAFIRLASLFFQGRTWCTILGETTEDVDRHLDAYDRDELNALRRLRYDVGAAFVRMLSEDRTFAPAVKEAIFDRLETMGLIALDGAGI